ncbi:hypothetical protein C8F01DRAFT_1101928 [Mycena amicta]|nr:hypothetical protein C8F01DRAFT_1101928 [Mycena amicta]
MPLFKSHPAPVDEPIANTNVDTPTRKHTGLFGRRRSVSPVGRTTTSPTRASVDHPAATTRRGGFFGGRRNSYDSDGGPNGTVGRANSVTSGTTPLHESIHKDPSIIAAKEKVAIAERSESEADRALHQARAMVREARDHVRVLEREAAAEAKRAQAKQALSNDISKSAGGLGRHGN